MNDAAKRLESVGMDGLAVAVGEHPLGVGRCRGRELGGLVGTPSSEDGEGGVVQSDARRAFLVLPRVWWTS